LCRALLYEGGGGPTDGARSVPDCWVASGVGGPFSYGDVATADIALAVLLNGIGVPLVRVVVGGGNDGDHYGGVTMPVPVEGIGS
jgi:hypothetical protein